MRLLITLLFVLPLAAADSGVLIPSDRNAPDASVLSLEEMSLNIGVDNGTARVSVRDRGPGLTLEQQQRVWERFYQAETVKHQGSDAGLGLGLYIVRTIIAQHQGQVGVESYPGQGATFWFLLLLADEPVQT